MSTLTVSYDTFLPEVLPYVRDCPEFVAINAIRSACMEFCEQTTFWRLVLDPITLVEGQAEYDFDVDIGTRVTNIIEAHYGDMPIEVKSTEELGALFNTNWREKTGGVQYLTQEEPDTVRVVCIPGAADVDTSLYITVALAPLRSSTRVAKDLYERYAEVIGFGARARLHDTPGQPYFDENAARRYRLWFESGYGKAKIAINQGHGRGPLSVRMVRI